MKRAADDAPTGTARLVFDLARPYRGWFVIILLAMLVEAAAGLAAPWPLKIVIDYAVGHQSAPHWLARLLGPGLAADGTALAAAAAVSLRSEEDTSELQSRFGKSYALLFLEK